MNILTRQNFYVQLDLNGTTKKDWFDLPLLRVDMSPGSPDVPEAAMGKTERSTSATKLGQNLTANMWTLPCATLPFHFHICLSRDLHIFISSYFNLIEATAEDVSN